MASFNNPRLTSLASPPNTKRYRMPGKPSIFTPVDSTKLGVASTPITSFGNVLAASGKTAAVTADVRDTQGGFVTASVSGVTAYALSGAGKSSVVAGTVTDTAYKCQVRRYPRTNTHLILSLSSPHHSPRLVVIL